MHSDQPARARFFLSDVYDGSLNIVATESADEQEATKLIDYYSHIKLTLTDASNLALMIRLEIAAIFSFDSHFLQPGVIRVPPVHL